MKWLAFVRGEEARPGVWNLWLRDLSSGAMHRHTSFRLGQVWGASWFPDGRSLCYSHEDQLVISQLEPRQDIVMDTPRPGHLVRTPAVSPDGLRIVFQVFKDGGWLVNVQTGEVQRILDDPTAEEFSWAPDGRRIAYHSRRDGAWRIWTMQVPG
jgi:Tol biopolymer transport system component